jgi:ketosteroid isomerase-like protein
MTKTSSMNASCANQQSKHVMKKIQYLLASICAAFALQANAAEPSTALKAELKAVLQANQSAGEAYDLKKFTETTTNQLTIVDEFPPFSWSGKGAAARYLKDMQAVVTKNKITNFKSEIKDATDVGLDQNVAYAVYPVSYTFKKGEMKEYEGEGFQTVIFKKSKDNKWLIENTTWGITSYKQK